MLTQIDDTELSKNEYLLKFFSDKVAELDSCSKPGVLDVPDGCTFHVERGKHGNLHVGIGLVIDGEQYICWETCTEFMTRMLNYSIRRLQKSASGQG